VRILTKSHRSDRYARAATVNAALVPFEFCADVESRDVADKFLCDILPPPHTGLTRPQGAQHRGSAGSLPKCALQAALPSFGSTFLPGQVGLAGLLKSGLVVLLSCCQAYCQAPSAPEAGPQNLKDSQGTIT
jgi:hypothetical protein